MIRAILSSVADVAVVPLQDVLGLGSEARMNLPGTRLATGSGVIHVTFSLMLWPQDFDPYLSL